MRQSRGQTVVATMGGRAEYRVREHWTQALMLAESLRRFGGRHAEDRVIVVTPDAAARRAPDIEARLEALGAEIVPLAMEEKSLAWDAASRVVAAAAAEAVAGEARELVWADCDTLVLRDLDAVALRRGEDVGYRPAYRANIGSRIAEPVDEFWSLVYEVCGVEEADVFPMAPCTADVQMRPYLNSGFVVVRPAAGILHTWSDRCAALLADPRAKRFTADDRYEPFVHQAVLSAVVTARSGREGTRELPASVNYGRHEHDAYPAETRARRLNDLITCRYEYPFEVNSWHDILPAEPPLSTWLADSLAALQPLLDVERLHAWREALIRNGVRT
jgi:hypothetical protein